MVREHVYAALFARLDALRPSVLISTGRFLPDNTLYAISKMPAAFQLQTGEKVVATTMDAGAALWQLNVDWYVYGGTAAKNTPITPQMNPVLDAVLGLLSIDGAAGPFVVDGRAYTLQINGIVEWYEGTIEGKCVIRIPVSAVPTG